MRSTNPVPDGQGSLGPAHETGNPASSANQAILDELLRSCCQELMQDYGVRAIRPADVEVSDPPTVWTVSAIDFAGSDLRGTIGLHMGPRMVQETYYAALGARIVAGSMEARDWACELVNQLMGRLKNKLRIFQVCVEVKIPRVLERPSRPNLTRVVLRHRFLCEQGKLIGYLDAVVAPGVVFIARAPEGPRLEEGELLLF